MRIKVLRPPLINHTNAFVINLVAIIVFDTTDTIGHTLKYLGYYKVEKWGQTRKINMPGILVVLIQCGDNRQACFYCDEDYQCCLDGLENYAHDSGCVVTYPG